MTIMKPCVGAEVKDDHGIMFWRRQGLLCIVGLGFYPRASFRGKGEVVLGREGEKIVAAEEGREVCKKILIHFLQDELNPGRSHDLDPYHPLSCPLFLFPLLPRRHKFSGRNNDYLPNVIERVLNAGADWHISPLRPLEESDYFRSTCLAHVGDRGLLIDIKEGLFIDLPRSGQARPETEVLIAVNETLEFHGLNIVAGGISRKDRVQDAGIADGGGDILREALRVALCLLLIGGHPQIGLQQENDKYEGGTYKDSSDSHGSIVRFAWRDCLNTGSGSTYTYNL